MDMLLLFDRASGRWSHNNWWSLLLHCWVIQLGFAALAAHAACQAGPNNAQDTGCPTKHNEVDKDDAKQIAGVSPGLKCSCRPVPMIQSICPTFKECSVREQYTKFQRHCDNHTSCWELLQKSLPPQSHQARHLPVSSSALITCTTIIAYSIHKWTAGAHCSEQGDDQSQNAQHDANGTNHLPTRNPNNCNGQESNPSAPLSKSETEFSTTRHPHNSQALLTLVSRCLASRPYRTALPRHSTKGATWRWSQAVPPRFRQ